MRAKSISRFVSGEGAPAIAAHLEAEALGMFVKSILAIPRTFCRWARREER